MEGSSDTRGDSLFVGSLESLRGLAALMVAVDHSMMVLKIGGMDMIWAKPFREIGPFDAKVAKLVLLFANGGAAVTIFFVLSGVVLGLSLDHTKLGGIRLYFAFLLRRMFRIYPAYIVAILFVLLYLFTGIINHNGVSIASTFFNWSYRYTPSLPEIASNLTLLNTTLVPIGWTLTTEIVVATFFPFLYVISRKWPGYAVCIVLLALMIPTIFPAYAGVIILPHVYKFFIGLLIPRYGKPIFQLIFGNRRTGRLWFLFSILLLLAERQLMDMRHPGFGIIETTGAMLIIFGLLHANQHGGWSLLEWHPIRKLGQQSYSFYLWHFPLLFVISWFMFALVPLGIIEEHALAASLLLCAISVSITYGIASLSYSLIEAPSIRNGKHFVSRFIVR